MSNRHLVFPKNLFEKEIEWAEMNLDEDEFEEFIEKLKDEKANFEEEYFEDLDYERKISNNGE